MTTDGCSPCLTQKSRSRTSGRKVPRTLTPGVWRRSIHAASASSCADHRCSPATSSPDSLSASTTGLNPRSCSEGGDELSTVERMDVPEDLLYTSDHEWIKRV